MIFKIATPGHITILFQVNGVGEAHCRTWGVTSKSDPGKKKTTPPKNHTNASAAQSDPHNQSTCIRVVKRSASAALCITKCLRNGGVTC